MSVRRLTHVVFCFACLFVVHRVTANEAADKLSHASNWAVLINVSRYWFNYRHASNVFSLYHTIKKLGIPDERVIVMNADDFACNPRNSCPAQIYNDAAKQTNLYTDTIEVDYRNYDVTLDSILRVLTDRHSPSTARSKRLLSDHNSNVLVYITGHGGNEFMKIQDAEEISALDLAGAIAEMHQRKRYKNLFLVLETCQAATMFARVTSPNVFMVAASRKGENSYAHQIDLDLGLSVIDRFTYNTQRFFEHVTIESGATVRDWYKTLTFPRLRSHIVHRYVKGLRVCSEELLGVSPNHIPLVDFFGHTARTRVTKGGGLLTGGADMVRDGNLGPPLDSEPTGDLVSQPAWRSYF